MPPTHDKWQGLPWYDRPLGDEARPAPTSSGFTGPGSRWLTDLSACRPAELLAGGLGRWALIDYAAEGRAGKIAGRLLHAERANPAADLALDLGVTGWHAVYVWLMGGDADLEKQFPADFDSVYSQSLGPALKLTGDGRFSTLFRTLSHDRMMWRGLEGCFWRYADLTGQTLTIRHQGGTVYLGAIQLVPLSDAEVAAVQRDRRDRSTRRLIVKSDALTPRQVEARIEHYRHRDVGAWIVGNDDSADLFAGEGSAGLRAARDATREIDAELYVCDRPSLWSAHFHWNDARARWFEQHPEHHCKDRDGTPTHQCSYAEHEVVEHMLERARASLRCAPDGFGYFFNRDPGLVLFEPAAMRGFQEAHGVDPLTLDDRDPRLLDWRAQIITAFLRRVRQTLDEEAAKQRIPRIKLVHAVLGDEAANRCFSFDVPRWVGEGLVDVLLVYPWIDYPDRWLAQGFADMDLPYFAGLVKGTGVKLYPMWLAGVWRTHWTPEHVRTNEYFTRAQRDYSQGADGISAWDEVGLDTSFHMDRWLRLGQRDRLAAYAAHDLPLPPKLRFTRFSGATPDRYPAGTGG